MSGMPTGFRVQVEKWLHAAGGFTSPPCVICGRGHASSDWVVGPIGDIHGRCMGCTDEAAPAHASHKPAARPL